jgi:hypothetical protein
MSIDNNPDEPNGKHAVTIDLVILILKEHEQSLDDAINKLSQIPPRLDGVSEINGRLEVINCNLDQLFTDINQLKTLVFGSL